MRKRDLLAHDADVSRCELESQADVFALELLVERNGRPALRLDLDRNDAPSRSMKRAGSVPKRVLGHGLHGSKR
jgi:hypothetical protein